LKRQNNKRSQQEENLSSAFANISLVNNPKLPVIFMNKKIHTLIYSISQPIPLAFGCLLKDPSTPGICIGKVHWVMQ
jgi:hypothetical protein